MAGRWIALSLLLATAAPAAARPAEDCQLAWGQVVRSYLTQNRTKGPEDVAFAPACQMEAQGKKDEARVEAVALGVAALAQLDMRGCIRFLETYVGAARPKDVCDLGGGDGEKLRALLRETMPARKPKG